MFSSCEYIISAVSKEQNPNHTQFPEYVFLGRSNVGKSSFINALTNQKKLAYTSQTPGKTKTMNFFLIDKKFYLVDAPGYGYVKKGRANMATFGSFIDQYLIDNRNLKLVFLLVDTKVGPTEDDILMADYLRYLTINFVIIATKSDKIGSTLLSRHLKNICEKLNISEKALIVTSSQRKMGFDRIYELLK
ncbi:MAG: ribosome biogenesis GTP-binding protein YihA/YsxC [Bacilli bacterium]